MVIRIKKGSHLRFHCLFALLVGLLLVRYSFGIDIPRIILTSIIIASAFMGNRDEILAILLCCISLHEAIDFYIAIFACIMILFIKNHSCVKIKIFIASGLLMILWELLHCFAYNITFPSLVIALVPIVVLIMMMSFDVSEIDYPFIVRAVAIMSSAICAVVLLNTVVQADFNFLNAVLGLRRLGVISEDAILTGGRINPNSLGVINVMVVTGLLQLRFLNCQKKADYILIIILITFGVLTSSRTFLVCLLIMFVLLIMGQIGGIRKKIHFFMGLLVITLAVWLLMIWLFPSVLEYYIGRFQVEDITTGRDILMMQYHNYIVSHLWVLLFGIGSADLSNKAVNIFQIANNGPHNSLQEIILAWGIPGLLMIVLLISIMIMESRRYSKKQILLNFIPLIVILTKSMAGQLLTSGYSMLALAFAYLSLCQDFTSATQTN